jgi:amino acid transporter
MSTLIRKHRPDSEPHDPSSASSGKGLQAGALTLKDSVVFGLASVAPAYSLAATLGFIVVAVGDFSAASILVAFVPMLFTAYAYRELNRAVPDCGTTFTWGTKAFGPWLGWLGGWAVALSGTIFLANAAQIVAQYLISSTAAVGTDRGWSWADTVASWGDADHVWVATTIGVLSILAVTAISYLGIKLSSRVQNALIYFQYGVMILFSGALLWSVARNGLPEGGVPFSWSMLNPFNIGSGTSLIAAVVLGVFLFWGWESTLSVNEETENPQSTPGRAALISTLILLVTYVGVTTTVVMVGGSGSGQLDYTDETVVGDVFTPLAQTVGPWLAVLVGIAIVVSSLSSSQTTILPTSRGMLAMGVYQAVPARFASIHQRFRSPGFSTLTMGIAAIVYYVGMTFVSQNLLYDSIYSIGLYITFYYALTGFSAAWYFRHEMRSVRDAMTRGVLPVLGALGLTFVFARSALDMWDPENNYETVFGVGAAFVLGIGGLLLGVVLMLVLAAFPQYKPFFHGRTLNRETRVLAPEDAELPGAEMPGTQLPRTSQQP